MKEKSLKAYIIKTVVIGLFLAFLIYMLMKIVSVNLTNEFQPTVEGSPEQSPGAGIVVFFVLALIAPIFSVVLYFVAYVLPSALILGSLLCLIGSITNLKSTKIAIKIINILFIVVASAILVTSIVKLVMFAIQMQNIQPIPVSE